MGKTGFTLIELIMVIVIIGLLSMVPLPKFINLRAKAIESTEDNIIAAINIAVKTQYLKNIVSGASTYPQAIPYTLLEISPRYKDFPTPIESLAIPDGINWLWYKATSLNAYYLYCPHYNGNFQGGGPPTKGRLYVYQYDASSPYSAGDIRLWGLLTGAH